MKLCLFTAFFINALIALQYGSIIAKFFHKKASEKNWEHFKTGAGIIGLIWSVLTIVKLLLCVIHLWRKTSVYTKCRNNIFCGLGIIATFAIIAKIECSQRGKVDEFFVFGIINIFHASYVIFITPNEEFCEWKQKSGRVYEILLVILVTVQIGFFYRSIIESVDHKENLNFLIIQFTFSLICASSTCDMLAILMGKLKLKEAKEEEEVELKTVKVEKRPSASAQPAAHVGYLEVKEEIPLSTRFNNAVRAFFQKN
ncbi:hypothetical protein CAEBREN_23885 [Caenorhabditis brenneri]|uniref:Uncharacterized protein n=1 Tax=Caenorhabditis brenneri TaxID=135651 RepID=G0MWT1_CAEBE|nr:hypothetical protein CAEBREN_23885 [Caenorhabditis brenneri]